MSYAVVRRLVIPLPRAIDLEMFGADSSHRLPGRPLHRRSHPFLCDVENLGHRARASSLWTARGGVGRGSYVVQRCVETPCHMLTLS